MLTLIVRSRSGSRASWIYFEHRAVGVFLREFEVGDPLGLALDRDDRGRHLHARMSDMGVSCGQEGAPRAVRPPGAHC